mmetsp:Transcript_14882/g.59678  ORF Transcript_14882/g.59678 Transcript_14882/m.59678 type:complete len:302 (+) Transcript_14882:111-1016(+)
MPPHEKYRTGRHYSPRISFLSHRGFFGRRFGGAFMTMTRACGPSDVSRSGRSESATSSRSAPLQTSFCSCGLSPVTRSIAARRSPTVLLSASSVATTCSVVPCLTTSGPNGAVSRCAKAPPEGVVASSSVATTSWCPLGIAGCGVGETPSSAATSPSSSSRTNTPSNGLSAPARSRSARTAEGGSARPVAALTSRGVLPDFIITVRSLGTMLIARIASSARPAVESAPTKQYRAGTSASSRDVPPPGGAAATTTRWKRSSSRSDAGPTAWRRASMRHTVRAAVESPARSRAASTRAKARRR